MKIYVSNLPQHANEQDIENLFIEFGSIIQTRIIRDAYSNESKGFAFVEMDDYMAGIKAIEAINTRELKGNKLVVNEARTKSDY